MPTYHLLIKGEVQGVFYRATAKKVADELGVTGWIKNTQDDDVEAVVTGTEEQLNRFITWCKTGPAMANVKDVIATGQEERKFEDFSVRR